MEWAQQAEPSSGACTSDCPQPGGPDLPWDAPWDAPWNAPLIPQTQLPGQPQIAMRGCGSGDVNHISTFPLDDVTAAPSVDSEFGAVGDASTVVGTDMGAFGPQIDTNSSTNLMGGMPPTLDGPPFFQQQPIRSQGHAAAPCLPSRGPSCPSAAEPLRAGQFHAAANNGTSTTNTKPTHEGKGKSNRSQNGGSRDNCLLRITNVPTTVPVAGIRSQFGQYGKIESIEFTFSRKSKGCAIIRFATAEMCQLAKQNMSKAAAATAAARAPNPTAPSADQPAGAIQKQDSSSSAILAAGNASSNSKKRRAPASGKRRGGARSRNVAGAGSVHDAAGLASGVVAGGGGGSGGGGGRGREASTGADDRGRPPVQPSAPGPLAATGLSAMAKLAPQILQTAGV